MVEYEEVEWDIKYDGDDFNVPLNSVHLMGQIWKPEGEPKFVYVFVHGLAVFITFKKDFFKIIQNMKGVAFACDHLGHGRSPGARVSCKIDEVVEETKQVIMLAHKRYPNLPILLHGHSMGGLTVLKLAMTNQDFVRQSPKLHGFLDVHKENQIVVKCVAFVASINAAVQKLNSMVELATFQTTWHPNGFRK